jgi:hypothetical protein
MVNVWSVAALQAKSEMVGGLRKCIRPFCEQMLWAHDGMRCALVLTSFTALEGLFTITGLESAGFDRFRHLFIRQQTWQVP